MSSFFGKKISTIAPAPQEAAQVAAPAPTPATPAAAPEAPAEPEPFIVAHNIGDGGYKYSNVTVDTRQIGSFFDHQKILIRCCEDLVHILETYNIQNISLTFRTISGDFVYNNLKIAVDTAVNADKQKWEITWSAPTGNTRMLKFHREMIRYLPGQLQERGGNKRRKKTKGKKIKRKKTKKQTSR